MLLYMYLKVKFFVAALSVLTIKNCIYHKLIIRWFPHST